MARHCIRALVGVAAASMALAACGGSDGTPGGAPTKAGTTSGASAGVAQAAKLVTEDRRAPKPLTIPPLDHRPAAGVKVDVISCKLPECLIAEPAYRAAAKALGWQLAIQRSDLTPEAIAAAWTQAVADKPKAILAYSLGPDEIVKSQMEQAQREGIPVVMGSTPLSVGEQGVDATVSSRPVWEAGTVALSDWAIADSAGKAKAVVIYDGAYPLQVAAFQAAQAEMRKLCSNCAIAGLTVQVTQVGKGIPGQVLSYLQKNPDVGYVMSPLSSLVLGVGPAIKSAGMSAKVATAWAQPTDLAAIKNGTQSAGVAMDSLSGVWRMVDVAVRLVTDGKAPQALLNPGGELQLFDRSNIGSADLKNIWAVPDVPQTFTAAWHAAS